MTSAPSITPTDAPRSLVALPKAHLHLHLEGAMRPATLTELARRRGAALPAARGYEGFPAFLERYGAACEVLSTEEDLRRLVREVVADAAADGAVWVEPQCNPARHRDRLGPPGAVLDVVLDEGARAAASAGIGFGLVVSVNRTSPVDAALDLAVLAAERTGRGVVGLGLAGDEALGPPEPFVRPFALAREAGLLSVPHAGELAGPGSIRGALDALGADRLAHGVRVAEDAELLARVAAEGVVLDVCPTSNAMLGVVPDLSAHPLTALMDAGARCTLNADDPLLFGPGLLEEYALARDVLRLDDAALAALARTSVEASGAPASLREKAAAAVDAWLAGSAA